MTSDVRNLVSSLPGWARSPWALAPVLFVVLVPVAVSLLRAPEFETTLEVFPTKPPGNAAAGVTEGSLVPDAVANRGIEDDARGWRRQPGFDLRRSAAEAHSGTASLAATRDGEIAIGGRAASTRIVLPAAGRYRVQAWVHLPRGYSGGPPAIMPEGFSRSGRAAARAGDPRVRGRWQLVWSDLVVDASQLEGKLVLRSGTPLPRRGQVLHWDDVRVLSANEPHMPPPALVNLISNPGFEHDRSGWGDPPAFTAERTEAVAHGGNASLRALSDHKPPSDTNAGYTYVVFPRARTYRVRAWVYIPRRARAARPNLSLEGFSGAKQLAQRLGDPNRRGRWQLVSSDYAISSRDLEGVLVLRVAPDLGSQPAGKTADRQTIVYWDDVTASVPRPEPPQDAARPANNLRSALEEPQLRFEVSLFAEDDRLYDPRRATVVRSPRGDALSFTVKISSDVPAEARRLGPPVRSALARAARRSTLRQAQASWQKLISEVGSRLPSKQRELLQRRAEVVQRMIGAQARDAVALPSPAPEPTPAQRAGERRVARNRQKVVARLGEDLPRRQRARVAQRAEDLQRITATQAAEFVVMPGRRVPEPTREVDRLLETLPGPFPPRVAPGAAAGAGLVCVLLLFGLLVAVAVLRQRTAAHGG